MTDPRDETLIALLHRHAGGNDLPRYVPEIAFQEAMAKGDDPIHVLPYLRDAGVEIKTMEDLLSAGSSPGEEDLQGFRVEEGIAVHLANDGLWLLFTR